MLKTAAFVTVLAALALASASVPGAPDPEFEAGGAAPGFFEENLAIVVNKTNPVDDLSSAELRRIFLAERRAWPGGRKITIAMREPGETERETLLRLICRMSDADFNKHFIQLSFTGEAQVSPKVLASTGGMLRFVFNVPGAIGYVRTAELDGSVKAVKVDGHGPGEALYRLKLPLR